MAKEKPVLVHLNKACLHFSCHRYSSTEDLFEQAASRSRANSRQNSMTDLTASAAYGSNSAMAYGSNSAMRQKFLFGSGANTPQASSTPLQQMPVYHQQTTAPGYHPQQTPVYVNSSGHALSLGAAFDLKAATEQLQLRTNELRVGGRTVVGAAEGGKKKKFGEWAI